MTAIDHDVTRKFGFFQLLFHQCDCHRIVIRTLVTAAQDDVAIGISLGPDDGNLSTLVNAQEAMRLRYRLQGVNCDREAAICSVFKTNGCRQAARHLTMCLRFSGPCPDRAPSNQIAEVLWADRIERLGSCR